jgi:hypothetical protein
VMRMQREVAEEGIHEARVYFGEHQTSRAWRSGRLEEPCFAVDW